MGRKARKGDTKTGSQWPGRQNMSRQPLTSPSVDRDLLIFAASRNLSPLAPVAFALSDPARSTRQILLVRELRGQRAKKSIPWLPRQRGSPSNVRPASSVQGSVPHVTTPRCFSLDYQWHRALRRSRPRANPVEGREQKSRHLARCSPTRKMIITWCR